MTHFLEDILREPRELKRSLAFLTGAEKDLLKRAAAMLNGASHIFLTGIGSSWHAALTAATIFYEAGKPVYLIDSAELLHFSEIPVESVVIMVSRTGRSVEIVRLISKAHANGAKVVGLTNNADGPLAREGDLAIVLEVEFDHGISVNTYLTLALAAGILASHAAGRFDENVARELSLAIADTERKIPVWISQIEDSAWLATDAAYYFLARGSSVGTCLETRLLWEEGVKKPATAMSTGAFRHGSQEIAGQGLRFGLWIDGRKMREEDLYVARDLSRIGAHVMVVGQNLPMAAGELVLTLPPIPAQWQYVIDAIPGQLLAERLSRLAGVDCDSFRFCAYIVEDEGGLLRKEDALENVEP